MTLGVGVYFNPLDRSLISNSVNCFLDKLNTFGSIYLSKAGVVEISVRDLVCLRLKNTCSLFFQCRLSRFCEIRVLEDCWTLSDYFCIYVYTIVCITFSKFPLISYFLFFVAIVWLTYILVCCFSGRLTFVCCLFFILLFLVVRLTVSKPFDIFLFSAFRIFSASSHALILCFCWFFSLTMLLPYFLT